MNNRIALITGAGMLGAHTARRLLDAGWEVVLVDRTLHRTYLADVVGHSSRLTLIEGDLLSESVWATLPEPEVVIHTAALIAARAQSDPLAALDINVRATFRLALWAAGVGARRFIAVSTWGVHDMDARGPFDEDSAIVSQHLTYYGATKMAMEELLGAVEAATDLEVVIVRPSVMYGYGPHLGGALGSQAIETIVIEALGGRDVVIPRNLLSQTELLYVDDAAAALAAAASVQLAASFERFILGSQQTTTADELAETLRKLFPEVSVRVDDSSQGMSPPGRDEPIDATRAVQALGIEVPRSRENGLAAFVDVLRSSSAAPQVASH
ncbi:NAD-dependent epimerase/dehydratase family protein [Subtercola sp. YIM 133946]|uniref:NAD-dependent epimerase/dehydratase family protein n=1 Tax=Subtercola sp. YIM 133946 TaxID=3118909 RepID=UPI002F959C02